MIFPEWVAPVLNWLINAYTTLLGTWKFLAFIERKRRK